MIDWGGLCGSAAIDWGGARRGALSPLTTHSPDALIGWP